MLHFHRVEPCPALRPFVNGFWLVECPASQAVPALLPLVPDGYPELVFPLRQAVCFSRADGRRLSGVHPALIGQLSRGIAQHAMPGGRWLFVKLFPTTPFLLFRTPMMLLADAVTELEALHAGADWRALARGIADVDDSDVATLVERIERQLLRALGRTTNEHALLDQAVRTIFRDRGVEPMTGLNLAARISRRHVEQLFRTRVGLSPKYYARLIRVKRASIELLQSGHRNRPGEVADRLGYFDASHFLKDFKLITGQSPSAFAADGASFPLDQKAAYLGQWDYS